MLYLNIKMLIQFFIIIIGFYILLTCLKYITSSSSSNNVNDDEEEEKIKTNDNIHHLQSTPKPLYSIIIVCNQYFFNMIESEIKKLSSEYKLFILKIQDKSPDPKYIQQTIKLIKNKLEEPKLRYCKHSIILNLNHKTLQTIKKEISNLPKQPDQVLHYILSSEAMKFWSDYQFQL